MHCITFGAPRVATAAIPNLEASSTSTAHLSNEAFLEANSIVQEIRHPNVEATPVFLSYINDGDLIATVREGYIKPLFEAIESTQMKQSTVDLPVPCFQFLGTVILLRDPSPNDFSKPAQYEACDVESKELDQVLYGSLDAHEIESYYLRWKHIGLMSLE